MIRVLWFSLSPCGSLRRNNVSRITQGWMISLEDELKKNQDIALSVAYYSEETESDFVFDRVHYYPLSIRYGSNSFIRLVRRHFVNDDVDKVLVQQLMKIVEKVSPDIIHICGTEANFGLIADYVKTIPIVYSIQGLLSPCSEKYFSGIPKNEQKSGDSIYDRIMGISSFAKFKKFSYEATRETFYLKSAKYIIGRTYWDYCITKMFNPSVLYYHVDEILRSPFYHVEWKKEHFNSTLRIVSTISPGIYKGFETLLRAAYILKVHSNIPFVWQVIGLMESDKYTKMCEEFKGLKSHDCNIVLLGKKDAAEMVNILREADLFCHTGHIENSPNSVCEAMIMGMPIIASYVGGTNSILEHNKEGILVQDGEPYGLAGAISDLYYNFDKAKEYGANARERALKRHNPVSVVNSLIETYHQILYGYNQ